ncbi:MAG: peptide/nickel transport system substrate-binding protein, partial [Thermotogota bacterium]|nr:peptide/nickel transport system substrate-binding protein [Thermotogota bacterium]
MKQFSTVTLLLLILLTASFVFGETYARNETLYAGGGLWAPPSNWNPITPWNAVTGTVGLIYETLYLYDPITDNMKPWLAQEGLWISDNVFRLKLRKGLTWSDGTPLTAKDVAFTFELAKKHPEIYYSSMWNWLADVKVIDDLTLDFHFSDPRYQEWRYNLYQIPILPEHVWSKKSKDEILTGANEPPIGSGPYLFETYSQDRMVYLRNDNWWATKLLGLKPAPKRIVYLRVLSNNVALGMILKGELDISNFFLPGIPRLKQAYGNIHTWYDGPPYMLPANTAFLFVNTVKKPLDNPELRKAMAYAINPKEIAEKVFENQVEVSNPLGFLNIPAWMNVYPEDVVRKYGFRYD